MCASMKWPTKYIVQWQNSQEPKDYGMLLTIFFKKDNVYKHMLIAQAISGRIHK